MEPVVRALEDRGAAGVVFITGEEIHNMIVSRVWGSPTPETLHDYVGIPVASLSFGDGSRLRARLSEAGRCPQGFRPASKAAGRKFPSSRPRSAARTRTS